MGAPTIVIDSDSQSQRLAQRLRDLRLERRWSLADLAERSKVSRATLSRIENDEVSPTATVLNRLCTAYGLTMSRLMMMVEDDFPPMIERRKQQVWQAPDGKFHRRSVSPPAARLRGEVVQCELKAKSVVDYDSPSRPGLEHHLVMLHGRLIMTVDGARHDLQAGDCLRYQLEGRSRFETTALIGASYLLFIV